MYAKYAILRDAKGLKDLEVAQKAEISPSTLSDWKAGRYKPKLDKIQKIARVLEVTIDDLIEESK